VKNPEADVVGTITFIFIQDEMEAMGDQMYTNEQFEGLLEIEQAKNNALERDLSVLLVVGRMYLDAIADDLDNEHLTLPDLIGIQMVKDVVNRYSENDRSVSEDPRVLVSEEIAYEIERELICCTEYDEHRKDRPSYDYKHDICWWGSAARDIALRVGNKYADA